MAASLQQILLAPDVQPQVVTDCLKLIEDEVSEKSGVSAAAVKLAYKTASAFAPGYLRTTVENLLPDIVEALAPYWTDFSTSGGSDFGDYLSKRGEEVGQALLKVSDHHAGESKRPVIVKAYQTVRGGAAKHIEAALPNVGKLVTKHAG